MDRLKLFSCSLILLFSTLLYAQKGNISGVIFDKNTGEYLPGVTIFAVGTSIGTITDLDGNFNLLIAEGSYNLRISFISYETLIIENIEVLSDETTLLGEIGMSTANISIDEVVITAQSIRNTENSLISLKRNSTNLVDGISAANFTKIGDSDAASSMKRVTGVSVSDGKYVYVRGLGDRYTKTMLNGVDIPGLDPDRNTLQMDLFPTNVIDNILVNKTFTPDLPADFTGGVINIEIKDFPTKKQGNISIGLGYNPKQHFNSNYLTYKGGSLDFLGIDDGSRKIPAKYNIPEFATVVGNPDGENGMRYKEILNSFNPTMAATQKTSFMDMSLGATYGNQIKKLHKTIGYNFAISYKNSTDLYVDAINSRYGLNGLPSVTDMEVRESQIGNYGENNTFLTGLAGLAIKNNYSKLRFYLLHLQNGSSKAGIFDFIGSDQGSNFSSIQHTLDYSQRSLTNILIDGKHIFDVSNMEIVWKVSPTFSMIYDPDVRFSRYEVNEDGSYRIGTEVGFPERIWRNLFETDLASLVHITKDYELMGRKSKLKFGAAHTFKYRNYNIRKFLLNIRGGADNVLDLSGNPDELFSEDFLWPYNGNPIYGTTFENDINKSYYYRANVNYLAGYLSSDNNLTENLKSSLGLRIEKFDQRYTGQNQEGSKILDNDKVLSDFNLFPSLNIIYNPIQNINFRTTYSKTIARPSMKELSFAEIYDPLSGSTFIGGLHKDVDPIKGIEYWSGNLQSTSIHNYDIRLERFGKDGQMISLSAFYKKFINPIELVQLAVQTGAFQPRNVGDGEVRGVEFELRQGLGFITDALQKFRFTSNITLTESRLKMSETEYLSRIGHAREGQQIENYRDMAGQSPYILNGGLSFNSGNHRKLKDFEAGLFYNVQGLTLQYVGIVDRPDIYTRPFHSLNFNSNTSLGKENRIRLGLKVANILGAKREMVYKSFEAADKYYEFRDPGRTFSLSIGYSFF